MPASLAQLRNLGSSVTSRSYSWDALVQKAWGSEWSAPDHAVYQTSNGRGFDSTDKGVTGIYATDNDLGLLVYNEQYPDMPRYLNVDSDGTQLDLNK